MDPKNRFNTSSKEFGLLEGGKQSGIKLRQARIRLSSVKSSQRTMPQKVPIRNILLTQENRTINMKFEIVYSQL